MTLPKGALQPNNAIRNRIAVVYSEDDVANAFAMSIRRGGYEVDVFTEPFLALEKIGSQHSIYLLALIGWRMPRLTGPYLALGLNKIDPGIKIILFSAWDFAYSYLDQIARTYNVKFDHFRMPIGSEELLEMINNKIKYDKFVDPSIIFQDSQRSEEGYRKTNDTNRKQRLFWPWGVGVASAALILCIILVAWLATLDSP